MHDTIELAHNVIAGEHNLIIQLLRDIDSGRERGIVFIWPPAPTVIEPSKLATVTTAIITGLATARIELAAIRASELGSADDCRLGSYEPPRYQRSQASPSWSRSIYESISDPRRAGVVAL